MCSESASVSCHAVRKAKLVLPDHQPLDVIGLDGNIGVVDFNVYVGNSHERHTFDDPCWIIGQPPSARGDSEVQWVRAVR